jgi:hypothetical protein
MMVEAMAGFLGEPSGPLPGVSPPTGHHPGGDHAPTSPAASSTVSDQAEPTAAGAGAGARVEG